MNYQVHSHRFGEEVIPQIILSDIVDPIKEAKVRIERGWPAVLKKYVLDKLLVQGWTGEVNLSSISGITITSMKKNVGLCFQTGNVARVYADLLKLQTLYTREVIGVGVLILPTYELGKSIGTNAACFERLVAELTIFERVISSPLVIIGLE